jgi:adenylate cyclase
MATSEATLQIEETLRASRDDTERRIAVARLVMFLLGLLTSVLLLLRREVPNYPVWVMALSCTYAGVIFALARRRRLTLRLMVSEVVLDMVAMGSIFIVTRMIRGPFSAEDFHQRAGFPTFILPASLFCLTLLNSLRYSRVCAVAGAVAAQAVFWPVALWVMEPHPARAVASGLLLLASGFAYFAAVKARQNLDTFARLQLLRRYLSPAAVQRVLQSSPDKALELGGEVVTVTLLAADLRDFTAMSEKLSAQQVVEHLNEYHGTMLQQIEGRGGVLDKFIGDGTLAVFGLDTSGEGRPADAGASSAVKAARDMVVALRLLNADRAHRGLVPLRMGIGIHTGQVVAGNIGAPGRRIEFTVIGDSVNTASRLESLTKEAHEQVLLSAETVRRLGRVEGVRALPAMRARGKDQALEVYGLALGEDAPVVVAVPETG